MTIGDFKLTGDAESVTVMRVGQNKTTGAETLTPIAYVRDLLGGLECIQRKRSSQTLQPDAQTVDKIVELLKAQHKELMAAVKKGCKECLKTQ